ncbi:MAG: DUF6531 domain-containing protein, partial [Nitrospirota bacterium]
MNKSINVIYCAWLILLGLSIKTPAWAQSLSASFENGRVHLTGSASFECVPEYGEYSSLATVVRYYSQYGEQFKSGGTNISFSTYDEHADCARPGTVLNYTAYYTGGTWRGDTEPVCLLSGSLPAYAGVTVPAWPEITVHEPQDSVFGQTTIRFNYEYFFFYNESKRLMLYAGNDKILDLQDLDASGYIETSYDFSNNKGFVLLEFSEICGSQIIPFAKLVYVDPEDGCQDKVGKPVSVSSGTVYSSEKDFSLNGAAPINFIRYYDSAETTKRDFGIFWGHSYDIRVISFGANTYKIINPDGSDVYYIDNNSDGIYDVELPKGEYSRLIKNSDDSFTREFFDGSYEEFNHAGYLTSIKDSSGNVTALSRNSTNKLTNITGPYGREITVSYNTGKKISSLTVLDGSPEGRVYSYTYLSSGLLGKVIYPDGSERNYEYVYITRTGYRLSGIKDERGNYIEKHTYDSQGRAVTSSSDETNELLTIDYIDNNHTTVTDSLGNVTTYTFDKTRGKSHTIQTSGPGCRECGQGDIQKTYDNNLNVTSITDARGNVTAMSYDDHGNMLSKTEAVGTAEERTTTYTYNEFSQILTVTDSDGNTTEYVYDDYGNLTEEIDAYGNVSVHTYGPHNERLSTTDRNSRTSTYAYDEYGNLAEVTDALGQTTFYTYDIFGNMVSMTDANGNSTLYEYDARDRLTKETGPDGSEVMYEYDAAGNKTAVIDAMGGRTEFTYNSRSLVESTRTPDGSSVHYTYDTGSNLISMITKDGSDNMLTNETYLYDDHNRRIKTTYTDGTYTEKGYDEVGNVISRRDENGSITVNTYDALNRLASVTDAEGNITSYTYDSRDNLTSVTDVNGNATYYTYDSLNRLVSTTSPDTGSTTYTYDNNGNMLTKTDSNGITAVHSYDALNRLTSIQYPDPLQSIYFYYDDAQTEYSAGKLTLMTDPPGITRYEYDKMGRVTMETRQINGLNYRTLYIYDLNGNVSTITYPGGRQITYSYDQLNKVTSVSETYLGETRILADNITYEPYGDITSMTYGNDITTSNTYDSRKRLNSLTVGSLKQLSYTRDAGSNITAVTDIMNPSNSKTYTYDALSRLTIATGPWGAITYSYDPAGNRTYETTDTGNTVYNYSVNS